MKKLWRRFRFYILVFVTSTALPSYGSYLASEKYDDPNIFPVCTAAVVIFAIAVLIVRYVRKKGLEKRHGTAQRPRA